LLLKQLAHHQDVYGRPHWVVIDEAHHMLAPTAELPVPELHEESSGTLLVTVHPAHLHSTELARVDTIVIVGTSPQQTLDELAAARGLDLPLLSEPALEPGQIVVWSREQPFELVKLVALESREDRRRHQRKYAVGELGPDKSFYFRGPSGALNLRAHNLALFLQMADGVDPETWTYHLERNDYSTWLRESVKDAELAEEVRQIEGDPGALDQSRALVRKAIDRRYTLPA
jgi:hypothetical protein